MLCQHAHGRLQKACIETQHRCHQASTRTPSLLPHPPPKEQHPHIQSRDPTPIESPGTPGHCHCTGDLRQVTDLPAPSSEGGEAKLGSSVPKGKGVTVSPIHSMMGRGPLLPPLSPSLLGRPQVSQEWRLLEGDSGLAPVEAHQDILSLPFRT